VVHSPNSRDLVEVNRFGTNPGSLRCWLYLPTILAPKTPLVVVLHGCTQTADGFNQGTGWTSLAEKNGFAVLFPEQRRENNGNLCFNWFEPVDTRRGSGEALSIREMIANMVLSHDIDPDQVFVTGLSAGGAMANVMLATYPEVFTGGAIIGGLPYGVAANVGQAFERMQGRNAPDTKTLVTALATASPHKGPWPKVSIWHGTHDQTVKQLNGQQIASQWLGVKGLLSASGKTEPVRGQFRQVWHGNTGNEEVEVYLVRGMGHGVPLSTGGEAPLGRTGPFMLETGISSTARIARSWGLADDDDVARAEGEVVSGPSQSRMPADIEAIVARAMGSAEARRPIPQSEAAAARTGEGVGKVINDALRAAGLIR
jgi:poly(hydroxyalkanoate) depolymerase family esterase